MGEVGENAEKDTSCPTGGTGPAGSRARAWSSRSPRDRRPINAPGCLVSHGRRGRAPLRERAGASAGRGERRRTRERRGGRRGLVRAPAGRSRRVELNSPRPASVPFMGAFFRKPLLLEKRKGNFYVWCSIPPLFMVRLLYRNLFI